MTTLPQPLISVVVPVYNRALSVAPTLDSVQDQTFPNFECIVVDDGSRDSDQLRAVVARYDTRFRYIRQENGGGGSARNRGIDAAEGKYVAFLDSDDLFLPGKLDYFARLIRENPHAAWYSQALVDRGTGKYWVRPRRAIGVDEDMGEYLFVHNQLVQTSTIVIDRQLVRRVRFDPDLRKQQDIDFAVRVHAEGVRFRMVQEPQVIWVDTQDAGRVSRTPGHEGPASWLARSEHFLSPQAVHGYRANVLAYYLARHHPLTAAQYLLDGWLRGGVGLPTTLRQSARCFLPKEAYRTLVDRFVGAFGKRI